jgi:hypothetical protein
MKNKFGFFFLFTIALGVMSCTPSRKLGTVTFQQNPPEIFSKASLKNLLRQNQSPSIVLRTPEHRTINKGEETIMLSPIYQAIENELLRSGFPIRDRELFNAVLGSARDKSYPALQELTNTDLILEISGFDINVEYNTNKYRDRKGRDRKVLGNIQLNGAAIKFKIILVGNNDVVGVYKFNYAPCTNGCQYYIDTAGRLYRAPSGSSEIPPYELVETNALEEFLRKCTRDLTEELRK